MSAHGAGTGGAWCTRNARSPPMVAPTPSPPWPAAPRPVTGAAGPTTVPAEVRAAIRSTQRHAAAAACVLVAVAVAIRLADGPRPMIAVLVAFAATCVVYGAHWATRVATCATAVPGRTAVAHVAGRGRSWSLVSIEGTEAPVVCWGRPRTRGHDLEPVTVFGDLGGHFVITSTHQCWLPVLPVLPGVLRSLVPARARPVLRVRGTRAPATHAPDPSPLHRLSDSPGDHGSMATDPHLDQRRDPSHRPDLRSYRH